MDLLQTLDSVQFSVCSSAATPLFQFFTATLSKAPKSKCVLQNCPTYLHIYFNQYTNTRIIQMIVLPSFT